jgi:hypothetical protein
MEAQMEYWCIESAMREPSFNASTDRKALVSAALRLSTICYERAQIIPERPGCLFLPTLKRFRGRHTN